MLGNGGSIFLECLKYTYLGVDFTGTGAWDVHIKDVLDNGRISCIVLLVIRILI